MRCHIFKLSRGKTAAPEGKENWARRGRPIQNTEKPQSEHFKLKGEEYLDPHFKAGAPELEAMPKRGKINRTQERKILPEHHHRGTDELSIEVPKKGKQKLEKKIAESVEDPLEEETPSKHHPSAAKSL